METKQKLRYGMTAIGNLRVCVFEGTATAETFERAIEEEGLTMRIIALIKAYYPDSDYPESKIVIKRNKNEKI